MITTLATKTTIDQMKTAITQVRAPSSKVGCFLLYFLEMQIPMELEELICYLVVRLFSASANYAAIYRPGTYLHTTGDVLFLTAPGVAWLHGLEMAVAMIALVAAILVFSQLTAYAYLLWLATAGYPAMSLGMPVYILYRPELFMARPVLF